MGFKPTFGSIDASGVQALAPSLDHVGLLAADVATTLAVFAALTGASPVPRLAAVRVGVGAASLAHPALEAGVTAALRAAVGRLSGAFEVVDVDDTALTDIVDSLDQIIRYEAWRVHGDQVGADPGRYGPDTLRLLRAGSEVTSDAYAAARQRREAQLEAVAALSTRIDVLVTPAAPYVAPVPTPPIDPPQGAVEGIFTVPHNLTGYPALVLPCGRDGDLPVGLQLSASQDADMHLIACAAAIEDAIAFERRPVANTPSPDGSARRSQPPTGRAASFRTQRLQRVGPCEAFGT